uniref:DUF547 domain-containing protein n=1 Tax=Pycnococcus provasolii TaxID=41880 RepID=A0A7S2B678_9CHLO
MFFVRTVLRRCLSPAETPGVLNRDAEETSMSKSEPEDAATLAKELNSAILNLEVECFADDGSGVDYAAVPGSDAFQTYTERTKALKNVSLDALRALSEDTQRCFWLNLYNALTVHGIVTAFAEAAEKKRSPPLSVLEIKDFWKSTAYDVGGVEFSLDDMEHGILRGNRPHPTQKGATHYFQPSDTEKLKLVLEAEPRIHFCLVCGAQSCPPIRVFVEKNLERGLVAAARGFCQREVEVDESRNTVTLSKIFDWYGVDFGAPDTTKLLTSVLGYLPDKDAQRAKLQTLLDKHGRAPPKVKYRAYEWRLNNKNT